MREAASIRCKGRCPYRFLRFAPAPVLPNGEGSLKAPGQGSGAASKAELTYPTEGEAPFPREILIPGSGVADMDHTVVFRPKAHTSSTTPSCVWVTRT